MDGQIQEELTLAAVFIGLGLIGTYGVNVTGDKVMSDLSSQSDTAARGENQ